MPREKPKPDRGPKPAPRPEPVPDPGPPARPIVPGPIGPLVPPYRGPVRMTGVVADWHTYHGWVWIDAYELNAAGDAVRRRTLFLMPAGARRLAQRDRPAGAALPQGGRGRRLRPVGTR
ncbi:hypothetical protein [Micromonospora humida]|uniref:hypothetical protein n=1 Tax=Micromonospora humida TaxID=2809018 RepID=UPI00341EEAFA